MCFGFTIIVPVLASITMRCNPFAKSLMMMPRDEPGGAIYWILFGSGCFIPREKGFNPGLNKCFRTSWSSCENAHSVSDIRSVAGVAAVGVAAVGGGGVAGELLGFGGDGVAGLLYDWGVGCLELCCVEVCCDCGVPALGMSCAPVVVSVGILADDSLTGRSCVDDGEAFQLRMRVSASAMFAKISLPAVFSLITTEVCLPMDIMAYLAGFASASAM